MKTEGNGIRVGDLRRELSALNDEAEVEVKVTDVHGARQEVVGLEALALRRDGWARLYVTVIAQEPLPLPSDPFEAAWVQAENAGACPWDLLSAMIGRRMCRTSLCSAWRAGAECGAGWPETYGFLNGAGRGDGRVKA